MSLHGPFSMWRVWSQDIELPMSQVIAGVRRRSMSRDAVCRMNGGEYPGDRGVDRLKPRYLHRPGRARHRPCSRLRERGAGSRGKPGPCLVGHVSNACETSLDVSQRSEWLACALRSLNADGFCAISYGSGYCLCCFALVAGPCEDDARACSTFTQ